MKIKIGTHTHDMAHALNILHESVMKDLYCLWEGNDLKVVMEDNEEVLQYDEEKSPVENFMDWVYVRNVVALHQLFEGGKTHVYFYDFELVEDGFKDSLDYWKELVNGYIECADDDFSDLTDKDIETVAQDLLDSDHLWTDIYDYVYESLCWFKNRQR